MTNIYCFHCLTQHHKIQVILVDSTYRCPRCGFAAQVRRVKLSDILWGRETVQPGRVWWAGGEAHCVERIGQ